MQSTQELDAYCLTHRQMAFSDAWNKVLVYFALAEEREPARPGYADYDELDGAGYDDRRQQSRSRGRAEAAPTQTRRSERSAPSNSRRAEEYDDIFGDDYQQPVSHLRPVSSPDANRSASRAKSRSNASVHLVLPKSFNDAQQIGDQFKDGVPVLINLQQSDPELSKRLIDFASGLTYALDGGMQKIADKVFILTPANVKFSAEERAQLMEQGFFNQS